ncbi:DUF2064 domain-containing protein [Streptomyces sp. TRM66268-LWL]|uniref:DUF2064 domain-containing protein n=1 Tax=Streptomyces polyasparticus TaxID=2767826 RepID=A0ABR7SXU5_9ACTN|nr:DUF2064 domain-containing protein [Streptomyces polyasparticus]MBC9719485.1 DUF2064 domain-containing protein [Streptomyces polyasparticus]
MTTLLVIAKSPFPGRVKTRLTPPYTPAEAAALAEAALTDTLHMALSAPADRRILVLDGEPGLWLPQGFDVVPQCAGRLDQRLAAAFDACSGPTLLVGMDTPQITVDLLASVQELGPHDASIGPAADGGYWALGLGTPNGAVVHGVPMSTSATGAVQRARLHAAGLHVRLLPVLRDVDTAADAQAVAAEVPLSRFATRWRAVHSAALQRAGAASCFASQEPLLSPPPTTAVLPALHPTGTAAHFRGLSR